MDFSRSDGGDSGSNLDEETRAHVSTALQHMAQGQPPAAIQALEPVAIAQQPVVDQLLAWLYSQTGAYQQGLPYAERTLGRGVGAGPIAANYLSWAQSDSTAHQYVPFFLRHALDAGWSIDPFGIAQQLQAQGDPDGALRVLSTSPRPSLQESEKRWSALLAEVQAGASRIDSTVVTTESAQVKAVDAMAEIEAKLEAEAARVTELVGDTTVLIQGAAAHHLANEYANRADEARQTARRWTLGTLVISVMAIALAGMFVLLGVAKDHNAADILTKAGLSLPLLALAAYLNRLGAEERRDARTWRHIELQIRTAQPYLANLPTDMGKEVQAALALRFFPGQSQNPHGGDSDSAADDAASVLKELQRRQAANGQVSAG